MKAALFALLTIAASSAAAQDSLRTPGPSANLHVTQASGSTISGVSTGSFTATSSSSTGFGLTLGYDFNRWLGIYTTLDDGGSQSIAATGMFSGSQSLYQIDAGVRFQVPLNKGKFVPYGLLAYSSRMLSGTTNTTFFGNGTMSEWGGAATLGAGVQIAGRSVAVDFAYMASIGSYGRLQYPDGAGFNTNAGSTTSSRFLGGVTWLIGPVGSPNGAAPPSQDTMVVGEAVRIRAGNTMVEGTVVVLHRDTITIQRVHKDTATQVDVPRECVASVERLLPERSLKGGAVRGGFIGAIAGSLIGSAVRTAQSSAPPNTGTFFVTYVLGGAILGGVAGAVFDHDVNRWQPLHFETVPATLESRDAACKSFNRKM